MKTYKCRRYTDEQLSRILGEHEAGTLHRGGVEDWSGPSGSWPELGCGYILVGCCVNQAAYNEPKHYIACTLNEAAATWFDSWYEPDITADELLTELELSTGAAQ